MRLRTFRLELVLVALLVLAGASALLARAPLGRLALPIALGIAIAKGLLLASEYMELRERRGSLRLIAMIGPAFVLLVLSFAVADVLTR